MTTLGERAKAKMKEAVNENFPNLSETTIKAQKRQCTVKSKPTQEDTTERTEEEPRCRK